MSVAVGLLVAALAANPDRWIDEHGPASAKTVIGECLTEANRPLSDPLVCVRRALDTCENEHGTYQRAMNDCATFSRLAWEARRAAVAKQLMTAQQVSTNFHSPDRLVALLAESEKHWDAWNSPDCEMQAALSEGGTFHRFARDMCLSDHAAYRTLELEALAEDWGKIFNVDGYDWPG
ncbi:MULTISPECIES: lysozyme inhibitor LprI family protein [unclassified Sphingobium]|uniref:lysozyme inhibitor LprI family protein n=1 Tax=unclassified Sphingobium TaxID=2611147 RepID=UPI0034359B62